MVAKGKHVAQKVINALILLNCDDAHWGERRRSSRALAEVLQVSDRKIDRVKRRFVEDGLEGLFRNGAGAKSLARAGRVAAPPIACDPAQALETAADDLPRAQGLEGLGRGSQTGGGQLPPLVA